MMPVLCSLIGGLPHARGGVSSLDQLIILCLVSSPRTWGCFWRVALPDEPEGVFPTHVGVFLRHNTLHYCGCRLPHARGGVSKGQRYVV